MAINQKIRLLENQIAQLHRNNGVLDKELQEIDKHGIVESIEKKFCSSQDKFEFQIQKQRERLQQFFKEIKFYTKYIKWMESSDIWGSSTTSPSNKKNLKKKKQQQQPIRASNFETNDLPVDYHLEDMKQQVFKYYNNFTEELETIVEIREKMRNAAILESDDVKDILQEVQAKNKALTQDLDKKRAQLNSELQSNDIVVVL